jgi:hypothetical protein
VSNPIPGHVRAAVYERDGMCCVRCGVHVGSDPERYSIQHRQPRGMGGTRDPLIHRLSLLVLVCGSGTTGCHGWMEFGQRRLATDDGWLISKFEAADPQTIPLRGLLHRPDIEALYLLDDGSKTSITAGSAA